MSRLRSTQLAFVLTVLCVPFVTRAQETRGNIQGRIADATGAVVPGATVKALSPATDLSKTVETNAEGAYNLMFLSPGVYNVTVSAKGFKTAQKDNVTLPIHDRVQIDFSLELGGITEQVQVTGQAELL